MCEGKSNTNGSAGASPSCEPPSCEFPDRKRLGHSVKQALGAPVIVFVTACTKDRDRWLATADCHDLLKDAWRRADAWKVGRYVVMPDHVHLFVTPGEKDFPLEKWVTYWKSLFTRLHAAPNHRWQAGFWDRQLRSDESYAQKWDYVRANPVRHGFVSDVAKWPFQGELNELQWWSG